jgi:branched-chain amino acid aminotransferase
VHKGRFFRLKDHLDRWDHSIAERRYQSLGYDREQVADVLHGCVARAGLKEAMITFAATRGSPATAHKDLRTCKNRFMVWAVPYYNVFSGPGREWQRHRRRQDHPLPPEAVDPTIKNFGRLDFVRALFEAYDREAKYAVLLDQEDNVTEGRGWNISCCATACMSPDRGVLEALPARLWSNCRQGSTSIAA